MRESDRGRHAVRTLDAAATPSTAVVPSATSRLTTHSSALRRDPEEEAAAEEEEEEEDHARPSATAVGPTDPIQAVASADDDYLFDGAREQRGVRRTDSTESEGCHGESRPDRVVLISRRILSRGLC